MRAGATAGDGDDTGRAGGARTVSRRQDATDGRRQVISLTPEGLRILADRRSASLQRLTGAVGATLTAAEQQLLLDVMPLLERIAEQL